VAFIGIFEENICNKIPFAFARFNDGEMAAILKDGRPISRGAQDYNPEMGDILRQALSDDIPGYYKGMPCAICFLKHFEAAYDISGVSDCHVPATALCNNGNFYRVFDVLSKNGGNDYFWIGGDDQNELRLPFHFGKCLKISSKNCFENDYKVLKSLWKDLNTGDTVLISGGPLSRILAWWYFKNRQDITCIDIGSLFDPFTKGVKYRYHENKLPYCSSCHTNQDYEPLK